VGAPTATVLQFTVKDKFGTTVDATAHCWTTHIVKQRQHFNGEEKRVIDAISDPEIVLEGNTPDEKEFYSKPDPGKGFQWGGARTVAVVKYTKHGSGILLTAYSTSGSIPRGVQLWP
jgi:hypothetical protein